MRPEKSRGAFDIKHYVRIVYSFTNFKGSSTKMENDSLEIKCHREHFQERDGLAVVDGGIFGTEPQILII